MNKGTLYLIPTVLGNESPEKVLPEGTLSVIRRLDYFIIEELRSARRFLRKAGMSRPFDEVNLILFNEHSGEVTSEYLEPLLAGIDAGLFSEAGTPCIADPGALVVAAAREAGIRIVPLSGPSSIFMALMASGFNGQHFAFLGYLPIDRNERVKKIREIEQTAKTKRQTQIFIETPYRNLQLFESLLATCHPDTQLCIACDIAGENEFIETLHIQDWKRRETPINKRPCVFLIY